MDNTQRSTESGTPVTLRASLLAAILLAVWLGTPPPASTQAARSAGADTTAIPLLDDTVSAPDRAPAPLAWATHSAGALRARGPLGRPVSHLTELFVGVPGFAVLDRDGFGQDPLLVVRGFHGGGERDDLLLTRDGLPLNDLATGRLAWDLFPPVALEGLEVVRGPASSAYGDGAVAGVVDLRPASASPENGLWELGASAPLALRGAAAFEGEILRLPVNGYAGLRHTAGYRDHAARTAVQAGGTFDLARSAGRSLSLAAYGAWSDANRPGPLTAAALDTDRTRSDLFYSYDAVGSWLARADLDAAWALSDATGLSGKLAAEIRQTSEILTAQTTLDAARTDEETIDTDRILGRVQLERSDVGLPWPGRLAVGVDASIGGLDTELREVVSGGRVTYVFFEPTRPLVASGDGSRKSVAGFARFEVRPSDALRLSLGGRFDRVADSYTPGRPSPGTRLTADHTAFSPRAALNVRWLDAARHTAHVYASAARIFRAPTPAQLFDPRPVPVVEGVEEPVSNPLLEPQRGTSLEIGARHGVVLVPGAWRAGVSLAAYRIDMEDEIVVDVGTFLYENVGESRHDGVEVGVEVEGPSRSALSVSFAAQDVTARAGADVGRRLKGVPELVLVADASRGVAGGVDVGVRLIRHGPAWLDDANTVRLPAFTRVDVGASATVAGVALFADVINALDERYSTGGFLSPGGGDLELFYPAARRVLRLGVRVGG